MKNECPPYYKVYVTNTVGVDTPIECSDLIKALIEQNDITGYPAFLYGNIIKYMFRINNKEDMYKDAFKALNYLNQFIDEIAKEVK